MSRPLPRHTHEPDFQVKLAAILIEVGEPLATTGPTHGTAAGDERKLRGIPCMARGVGGTQPQTQPLAETIRRNP